MNLLANAEEVGLIPGLGRSRREGNGNPLQYSCPGNPMDRGAGQAIAQGVTKNWTQQLETKYIFCLKKNSLW